MGPYRHFIKTNNRTQIRELHASLTNMHFIKTNNRTHIMELHASLTNMHFIKTNNCSYATTSCFINYMTRQRHQ